jgi:hypothetical protein
MLLEEKISYCGLPCTSCPIYWVSREQDNDIKTRMRKKIAEISNSLYNTKISGEDIGDCDGCKTQGNRLFSGCLSCEIRKCAMEKSHLNCAHCNEYICDKLRQLYDIDTNGKIFLDIVKSLL